MILHRIIITIIGVTSLSSAFESCETLDSLISATVTMTSRITTEAIIIDTAGTMQGKVTACITPKAVLKDTSMNEMVGNEMIEGYWPLTQAQIERYPKWKEHPKRSLGLFYHCQNPGVVALTFDDGPSKYTPRLLRILEEEHVKATFFVIASNLDHASSPGWKMNRRTLRRMINQGHLVASHTYSHRNLVNIGASAAEEDMKRADDVFNDVIGFCPKIMRPPEGAINEEIATVLHSLGYSVVIWSHDTNDWRFVDKDPEHSIHYIQNRILPLSLPNADSPIILQHDIHQGTVKVQREIIRILKSKGYRFVTMDECIGVDPYRY